MDSNITYVNNNKIYSQINNNYYTKYIPKTKNSHKNSFSIGTNLVEVINYSFYRYSRSFK